MSLPENWWENYQREQKEKSDAATKELCELLTSRGGGGWRSMRVDYSGGHDQGDIESIHVHKEPMSEEDIIDMDHGWMGSEGHDWAPIETHDDPFVMIDGKWVQTVTNKTEAMEWGNKVQDLAWPLVSRKWGGFAFDGHVQGILVLDAVTGQITRRDAVGTTQYETEVETF